MKDQGAALQPAFRDVLRQLTETPAEEPEKPRRKRAAPRKKAEKAD
jgi:hypothetical protein